MLDVWFASEKGPLAFHTPAPGYMLGLRWPPSLQCQVCPRAGVHARSLQAVPKCHGLENVMYPAVH